MNDISEITFIPLHRGRLGLTSCPGWPCAIGQPADWPAIVEAIRRRPATAVVSLMETPEFERLGLSELPRLLDEIMALWLHLPIRDHDIPGQRWKERWQLARLLIAGLLIEGNNVVIHCLDGLGLTGTVAALCLVDGGSYSGREAINEIRHVHNIHAVETPQQRQLVQRYVPEPVLTTDTVRDDLERVSAKLEMRSLLTNAGRIDPDNARIALQQW